MSEKKDIRNYSVRNRVSYGQTIGEKFFLRTPVCMFGTFFGDDSFTSNISRAYFA